MTQAAAALLRRCYGPADQTAFAGLSGDVNPLHLDALAARRTLIGACAVHGIHLVLSAIDAAVRRGLGGGQAITRLSARFNKPVLVGDRVTFRIGEHADHTVRIVGDVQSDQVLEIAARFGERQAPVPSVPAPPPVLDLHDLSFSELAAQRGAIAIGVDSNAAGVFPYAVGALGLGAFAELLALSRLVGMRCPGRHSLLAQFDVLIGRAGPIGDMQFRVEEVDPRFHRVEIAVRGAVVSGIVRALFRPPPQPQPSIAEIARLVKPGEFAGSVALVVGGSRGLGETVAKIVAVGGGRSIITFYRGGGDAARVADEIHASGGRCDTMLLDVCRDSRALARLFRSPDAPRSLYYFATPPIFGRRRGFFGHALLREFIRYYVTALGTLMDAAAIAGGALRVFYPSSVAADEQLRDMAEYALAKRASEELCAYYNRYSPNIDIVVERLPRIKTDQTATLLDVPAADAADIMLPIIRKLETPINQGASGLSNAAAHPV